MQKIFIGLVLVLSGCVHGEAEVAVVDEPVVAEVVEQAEAIHPLPKPQPPAKPGARNYTAPYPDYVLKPSAKPAVKVDESRGFTKIKITKTEELANTGFVKKRGTSTSDFFKSTSTSVVKEDVGENVKEAVEIAVQPQAAAQPKELNKVEKAIALPPKEMAEDKRYKTFKRIDDDLAHDSRSFRGAIAEFIFPEINDVDKEDPVGKKQPTAYCYGSMSDSTCYLKPIPGQEYRRIGSGL